jgi:hypothetical protein
MTIESPAGVESCTDLDLEDGVPAFALGTDIHDSREVDQSLCLDIFQYTVSEITSECRHCSMSWEEVKVSGTGLQTDSELKQSVYDL